MERFACSIEVISVILEKYKCVMVSPLLKDNDDINVFIILAQIIAYLKDVNITVVISSLHFNSTING